MTMARPQSTSSLALTAAQCRAADRHAIEQLGIPGIVLMENAGRNAADLIERWALRRHRNMKGSPRICIICGKGNNGGDGFVIARHLLLRGLTVHVDLVADPASLSPDAATNFTIVKNMNTPIDFLKSTVDQRKAARRWRQSTVLVDALLGTGFAGQVRSPLSDIIARIDIISGPLIVAVDVPSGLNADTGQTGGIAVRADRTITFIAEKIGFSKAAARPYVGRVHIVDIGAPLPNRKNT